MEVHVEPASHKTTILLTPSLHERLSRLARVRGVSMGQLIRTAVEALVVRSAPENKTPRRRTGEGFDGGRYWI